ncbi:glycogenin glucosyltransferase GLG1 SKDI_11G2660 [Saccharomyces kudriavzevii IFO 1802]|uniref:Uncharacterized protein n=2 Tax=Saccharomyces kudriavzevii (strain ATCC MYA-4449 / AS 2.2408 / CBS 8840 / NBRC 1802 / NCYC 2889) TaxID=226230 RepID=A0AA35J280_SACK1|nr:uncharacterized protein SKDI_11G2660 [Saccharomyces kudriavzevii IFO 1802]EJT41778.1 GLG1-like protein [Saccharomyces kudriavzevii IFO 1802]CAI4045256.1 hypothetical protein SKDI_11G2660 [Saccharomyces kudriavzevii IFO 1802]
MSRKLAIATLLYSADYLPGVFALGHQVNKFLEEAGKKDSIQTCLIVTTSLFNDTLSGFAKDLLNSVYTKIVLVSPLEFQDESVQRNSENLALLKRPELSAALIKARLWELTQFEQVLYLDSDTLPLNKGFLRLFDIMSKQNKLQIGAAADIGWPDMFNSGVMILIPDAGTASGLQDYILENTSIDGSDQGILNQFFNQNCCTDELIKESFPREWVQLSFTYNVTTPNLGYESSPAMNYFKPTIKLIHFIGRHKPWSLWSQKNFIKNEYHDQWNEVYNEFKKENGVEVEVPKVGIDDFDDTENDHTKTSTEEISQVSEPAPVPEVAATNTPGDNIEDSGNEPPSNPVPLDFTKWLTTFINKDYSISQQATENDEQPNENDGNENNSSPRSDQESSINDIQEPVVPSNDVSAQYTNEPQEHTNDGDATDNTTSGSEQKSLIENLQEPSTINNDVSVRPKNENGEHPKESGDSADDSNPEPEQKNSMNHMQDSIASNTDLSEDVKQHGLIDDNIQYLEKEKEGYEEFLPDVHETDAIDDEETEFFDDGVEEAVEGENEGEGKAKSSAAEDSQEGAKPAECKSGKPQEELPNFKFDWEASDYLSKVERCFPDDIFEYAVK